MRIVELPRFQPRNFQTEIIESVLIKHNQRIGISVARRGGKDYIGLAIADAIALSKPGANIGYLGLSLKSLKKILMSNNQEGLPMYEAVINVSDYLIPTRGKQYFHKEMSCFKYKNGSIIYLLGTDQSMELGTSMDALIITEAGRIPFSAWEFLIPSIEGMNGIIVQISTPFYGSEFNDLMDGDHQMSPSYKCYIVPADKLLEADGSRVYPDKKLKKIKSEMDRASFEQDYMCNTKSINSTSIMGESLLAADIIKLPRISDNYILNKHNDIKLTCVFDIGQSDSTAMTVCIEDYENEPIIMDYMIQNKTSLSAFAERIKELSSELKIDPSMIDIILPFDSDHELQGYAGKINRYQEFKDSMDDYNVHLLTRADKMRGIQVARQVLETGKLRIAGTTDGNTMVHTPRMKLWVKHVASINYKVEKSTNKIQYVVDKRSGSYGDHPLDSLRYLVMWKFKDLFYRDIAENNTIRNTPQDEEIPFVAGDYMNFMG